MLNPDQTDAVGKMDSFEENKADICVINMQWPYKCPRYLKQQVGVPKTQNVVLKLKQKSINLEPSNM